MALSVESKAKRTIRMEEKNIANYLYLLTNPFLHNTFQCPTPERRNEIETALSASRKRLAAATSVLQSSGQEDR